MSTYSAGSRRSPPSSGRYSDDFASDEERESTPRHRNSYFQDRLALPSTTDSLTTQSLGTRYWTTESTIGKARHARAFNTPAHYTCVAH
ncbi:hypothetical protein PoB_003504100 [Plakobranchus ocellatus]|uniref:Uncharacterized protein n=1 Tax=Plakobranchus ocellatus TaxID=259542 RepID=A0AAV4APP3_9GAST|nr:hypothetical protein PoB_003504100 [Plakobranchus ocellatus]